MKVFHKTLVLLGPPGSFSDMAAQKLSGKWRKRYVFSFQQLFSRMKKGDMVLVPVKNKIIGKISAVSRFGKKSKWRILKRFRIPVRFVLAAKKKNPLQNIERIYASAFAKQQCRKYLERNFPKIHFVSRPFKTTSAAFKKIVQLKWKMAAGSAAIGSELGAKCYGLTILARNIQDAKNNWTEFALIKRT